jgi:uncharacterized membrane protein YhaH (DUF805 family)
MAKEIIVEQSDFRRPVSFFLSPRGRCSLGQYWTGILSLVFIGIILWAADRYVITNKFAFSETQRAVAETFAIAILLTSIWAYLCLAVKRFHDLNRSGFMLLWLLIPIVGVSMLVLWLGTTPGSESLNEYDIIRRRNRDGPARATQ